MIFFLSVLYSVSDSFSTQHSRKLLSYLFGIKMYPISLSWTCLSIGTFLVTENSLFLKPNMPHLQIVLNILKFFLVLNFIYFYPLVLVLLSGLNRKIGIYCSIPWKCIKCRGFQERLLR